MPPAMAAFIVKCIHGLPFTIKLILKSETQIGEVKIGVYPKV